MGVRGVAADPAPDRPAASADARDLASAYDEYARSLYGYCSWMLHEPAHGRGGAAEAVRDTFIAAAAEPGGLPDSVQLRTWLFTLARRECLHRGPTAPDGPDEASDLTSQPAAIGQNADQAEVLRRIHGALAGLDHDQREIIELNHRHGLDAANLAAVLGMPQNDVNDLASRARDRLEKALGSLLVARAGRAACPTLDTILAGWDGRLTTLTPRMHDTASYHIERCEACRRSYRRAMPAAVLSGLEPLAAVPSGLRAQVLDLCTGSSPDAMAYRQDVTNRTDSPLSAGSPRKTRLPGWNVVRDNPGAATATAAVVLWAMAALGAVLITAVGGRTSGDIVARTSAGPTAAASAPARRSGGAPVRVKVTSSPSPGTSLSPGGVAATVAPTHDTAG